MAVLPSENIQARNKRFPDMEGKSIEEKSKPKYNKEMAEALYCMYAGNKAQFGVSSDSYFDKLRTFGKGKQSAEQYKDFLAQSGINLKEDSTIHSLDQSIRDSDRNGWWNTLWDVMSPVPHMKTTIKGKLIDTDCDVRAHVIDPDADDGEWMELARQATRMALKGPMDAVRQTVGLPPSGSDIITDDIDELIELKEDGAFKPAYLHDLEKGVKRMEQVSHWSDEKKTKIIDDIFDFGVCFMYPEVKSNEVFWEYADPKEVIMQWSQDANFRDAEKAGVFKKMKITDLRAISHKITDGNKTGLTEKELHTIADKYNGYFGNPNEAEWDDFGKEITYSTDKQYNEHRVLVLKVYWKDIHKEKRLEYTNKYGKKLTYELTDDTKIKEDSRRKVKTQCTKMLYHCSWIVGTDYVFDYGVMPHQPRIEYNDVEIPIKGFKMNESSYMHRLLPIASMYAISWLRFVNAIAKAQNDFYALNTAMLAEVTDGGKKFDVTDIIKMFRQENIFLFNGHYGGPNMGGNGIPIQKLPGTLQEDISKELMLMESYISLIEQMTGLSPIALGASPAPDQAVKTSEIALNSTNTSLAVIIDAIRLMKESLSRVSIPMMQNLIKSSEEAQRSYSMVIGRDGVKRIMEARNNFTEYGVEMVNRPDKEQKRRLMELAKLSMDKRNAGQPGITASQFAWIDDQIQTGSTYKTVYYKFKYWERKAQKEYDRKQQENIQLQNEGIQKNEMIKAQAAERQLQMKAQLDTQSEQVKSQNKIREMITKSALEKDMSIVDIQRRLQLPTQKQPPQAM